MIYGKNNLEKTKEGFVESGGMIVRFLGEGIGFQVQLKHFCGAYVAGY